MTKKLHFERGDKVCGGKKKYSDLNDRLKLQLERYNPRDKLNFLRSVAHNIHIF